MLPRSIKGLPCAKKMKKPIVLLWVILLQALIFVQGTQATQNRPLVLRNVTLIDMRSPAPQANTTVIVSDNRIANIGKNIKIPKNAQVIDASGKVLIPGLWDMHVHLFNNVSGDGTNNKDAYFPLFIANGVTGVRDMWTDADDLRLVREWQAGLEAGNLIAPRIAPGSAIVDGVPTFLPNMLGVATPDEARLAVRKLKAEGAGFIKVYWNLKPEVYRAIADEAKKLGIAFAGHVPFSMSAAQVSDAGQKSIEHLTGILENCATDDEKWRRVTKLTPVLTEELWATQDENKCRELFRRFAKNKTWQTPTAVLHRMMFLTDDDYFRKDERLKYVNANERQFWLKRANQPRQVSRQTRQERFEKMLSTIRKMYQMGVPIMAGTDVGNEFLYPGFSLHDELELFVQAGLTSFEALQTATINPAKYLDAEKSLGTIEKGKFADLVLLEANPLENISNTRKINAVVINGKYLSKETLNKMLKDVETSMKNK